MKLFVVVLIILVVGLIIGAVIGALVYRNNSSKFESLAFNINNGIKKGTLKAEEAKKLIETLTKSFSS